MLGAATTLVTGGMFRTLEKLRLKPGKGRRSPTGRAAMAEAAAIMDEKKELEGVSREALIREVQQLVREINAAKVYVPEGSAKAAAILEGWQHGLFETAGTMWWEDGAASATAAPARKVRRVRGATWSPRADVPDDSGSDSDDNAEPEAEEPYTIIEFDDSKAHLSRARSVMEVPCSRNPYGEPLLQL